ncbi:MAG TPA: CBS domain-containing protein [Deltaproteobacteria bacterium]|nr:MAG: CBS domain-containing protein [Deltaproteobacteria bacterium]HDM74906.1 CBS domain-containing protein [Deltaproteobacteria bacterium]
MKLEEIMTTRVVTLEMDDTLEVIKEIFENTRFHHLLVLENGKLRGIVSDRDFARHISPFISTLSERTQDVNTLKKKVHQIMSRNLITASKETSIKDATQILLKTNVSCLPITSEDGTLEGIVTMRDLLRALLKNHLQTLKECKGDIE